MSYGASWIQYGPTGTLRELQAHVWTVRDDIGARERRVARAIEELARESGQLEALRAHYARAERDLRDRQVEAERQVVALKMSGAV